MKILTTNYVFNAVAKTITFSDYASILLERVLLITNVTDNIIIYNFADATKGGTVATNVLTLTYNTTAMSDTDDLQIFYDDADAEMPINDGGNSITVDGTFWQATQPVSATDLDIRNLAQTQDNVRIWANTIIDGTGTNVIPLADAAGHLQIDVLSGGGGGTLVVDDELVNAADTGLLILGTDGTNYQILAVDASGNLQVDILNASLAVTGTFWQATQPISAASLPLPTGAATSALQGGGLPAALGAGGGLKVDGSGTALPVSGTVTVGSITAGDNNIGNVDVVTLPAITIAAAQTLATVTTVGTVTTLTGTTTLTPGTAAANLGKAEDVAHASGDVGVAVWGVRDDTLGIFSGTEGDYEPFHMTAAGRLYTSATIDAALPAGTNAIGKLAANNGVDIGDVDVKSIAAGDTNIGNVDVVTLPTITQSTKHDAKIYKTAVFDASASGNLVAAVAGKVIKLHASTIQAQNTVVVNLNNGAAGASLMEWSFQAREGAVIPMANAPAYWAVTSVNTALYVTLSAAVVVTITAIYSDDDTS